MGISLAGGGNLFKTGVTPSLLAIHATPGQDKRHSRSNNLHRLASERLQNLMLQLEFVFSSMNDLLVSHQNHRQEKPIHKLIFRAEQIHFTTGVRGGDQFLNPLEPLLVSAGCQ